MIEEKKFFMREAFRVAIEGVVKGVGGPFGAVLEGLTATEKQYPFIIYGIDWLAYAHIVIALLFIGVYKDPIKNIWIIEWAMWSCVIIFPVAFIFGPIRNIPFEHQLIDCSFGVIGLLVLYFTRKKIKQLERLPIGRK